MKPIFKYFLFASALPFLASCSSDEPGPETLSEGKYPMEFTVAIAPTSRVTANDMALSWSAGDQIKITVTQDGVIQSTIATLDANGAITNYDPQIYWINSGEASVNATYTQLDNFADQSTDLAYALVASTTATFGSPVQLKMNHSLAQVRVDLTGFRAENVTSVYVNNYTFCTLSGQTITEGDAGYIKMKKKGNYFVANVVPTNTIPGKFILVDRMEPSFTAPAKLEAGNIYTISLSSQIVDNTNLNGHTGVLMRAASETEPALYFAPTNLGASKPGDPGLYYWWGSLQGHAVGSGYNFSEAACDTRGKDIQSLCARTYITSTNSFMAYLTDKYDAAHQALGGDWHIPTSKDYDWLIANCVWTKTAASGNNLGGYTVKSKTTGNSIFLPFAGHYIGTELKYNYSEYQTCVPWSGDVSYFVLDLEGDKIRVIGTPRDYGNPIRPVACTKHTM